MIVKTNAWHYHKLREWECCGRLWQVLLSKYFPEREHWNPVCPTCKETIK